MGSPSSISSLGVTVNGITYKWDGEDTASPDLIDPLLFDIHGDNLDKQTKKAIRMHCLSRIKECDMGLTMNELESAALSFEEGYMKGMKRLAGRLEKLLVVFGIIEQHYDQSQE